MSSKELRRVEVFGQVARQALRLRDAATILQLSYRQTKRLWRRYRQAGPGSLQHGNAGRSSHRAKPASFREQALQLIRAKYSGSAEERFGPTLAAEHLADEDGLRIAAETLRRWMLEAGLWSRQRGRKRAHRRRRPRKEHFGELVQLDGTFHAWFEQRGPRGCVMNMVDDATGTTVAHLGKEETLWDAVAVLRLWIASYGVPLALYTDWKNVYKVAPTPAQQLRGETPLTQFGRMCARLGIRIIAANSPQAKGRVERKNGVHQDRLVKKMRRLGIDNYAAANAYLQAVYLPALNQRFAVNAARPEDYHRAKPSAAELDDIFRMETERSVSNDWVVRYNNRYLQLLPPRRCDGPRRKALVCESADGSLQVRYGDEGSAWEEIPAPQKDPPLTASTVHVPYSWPRYKPGPEHPYRRMSAARQRHIRGQRLREAHAARRGGSACATPGAAQTAAPGSAPALPSPLNAKPEEGTFLSS